MSERGDAYIGWRAWALAAVVAALVHIPLLWFGWFERGADTPQDELIRLNLELAPTEPIEVPTPDSLNIRWSLGAEPDPTAPIPEFPTMRAAGSGLSGGLSGGLDTSFGARRVMSPDVLQPSGDRLDAQLELTDSERLLNAALDAQVPGAAALQQPLETDEPPDSPPEAARVANSNTEASERPVDDRGAVRRAEVTAPRPQTETSSQAPLQAPLQAAQQPSAPAERENPIDALVAEALTGTAAIRTPQQVELAELPEREALEPQSRPEAEPALTAESSPPQVQTTRQATPRTAPPQAQVRRPPNPASAPASTQAVARASAQAATARPVQPSASAAAGPDARYDPAGPAGPVSVTGDVFFSQLASQLFAANDAVVRSAGPDARKQVIDVRFAIDRGGRVMRVWLPQSLGSRALDQQAMALIWRAAPFPQLAPDMPQQALELTFPVVVVR